MNYLGKNNIGDKFEDYDSTNHCVILTFLDKENNINILKQYSDEEIMSNRHPFFLFYSLNCSKTRYFI